MLTTRAARIATPPTTPVGLFTARNEPEYQATCLTADYGASQVVGTVFATTVRAIRDLWWPGTRGLRGHGGCG